MRHIFFLLLISLSLFYCTETRDRNNKQSNVKSLGDSLDIDSISNQSTESEIIKGSGSRHDSSIFIDVLSKFYSSKDYYVNLYYSDNYDEETNNILEQARTEVIFEDGEELRERLLREVAEKHLQTENLDSLYVFDENQEVIDSIVLNSIEYYDNMIETSYVASYSHPKNLSGKLVISKLPNSLELKKSPLFKKDSILLDKMLENLNIELKYFNNAQHLKYREDTLSIISFSDKNFDHHIYFLHNGIIKDSLNGYAINKLLPVPIASKSNAYYISFNEVPDTDNFWTALLEINLTSGRISNLKENRYSKE